MYIGSLFDNKVNKDFKYSYYQRGTKLPYNPDLTGEEKEQEFYTPKNGYLFVGREIAWEETKLLYGGIDIKFDFSKKVFTDHVCITQAEDSKMGSVEIFTLSSDNYKKIGNYFPETGKTIASSEIKIPVAEYVENIIIRINGCCSPVVIEKLDILGGINLSDSVWPIPLKFDFKEGGYSLSLIKTISCTNEEELFAANYIKEIFSKVLNKELEIVAENGDICLKALPACDKDKYILKSENGRCMIEGTGRRGLMYGLSALVQLVDGDFVKNATLENEDFMQIRGVHFALPNKSSIDFIKNLVKYVFIPNHYNMVFLEIAGAMKYDNYPEIHKAWERVCEGYEKGELPTPSHYGFVSRDIWEKNEVKDFCDYISSYGLELVPEVQTWGHTQYITCAYPHLAEIPVDLSEEENVNLRNLDENAKRSDVYYHTMCPNHPDYYKVTFGIIDEITDLLKPKRYIHLGHDEVYNISECERCKNLSRADIVVKEITTLYEYIAKKNLTMMIWGDMVQKMPYSAPNAAAFIPKDIIMLDFVWYFDMDKDIEDHLLKNGFKVVMGNMYSSHYTRYATRSKKEGIIGAEVSTWVRGCDEEHYASEGKIFDFVYSATGICNSSYDPEFRFTYYEIIKPLLTDLRAVLGGFDSEKEGKSIQIGGNEENIPYDIRGIIPYKNALSVSAFNPIKEIEINDSFDSVAITHATDIFGHRIMWKPMFVAGYYTLNYEDGTSYKKALRFGGEIYNYLSGFGDILNSQFFRHQGYIGTYLLAPECGKTHNGEGYNLGTYTMKNPYPEKKVKSLTIEHDKSLGVKIMVFDVKIK